MFERYLSWLLRKHIAARDSLTFSENAKPAEPPSLVDYNSYGSGRLGYGAIAVSWDLTAVGRVD